MTPKVEQALKAVGAVLKRSKKHRVYELPNGRNVVVASTPSDNHAEQNALREIRKVAGVEKPKKVDRKTERREKQGRREADWSLKTNPLAAALTQSGVVEQQLRDEIEKLSAANRLLESSNCAFYNTLLSLRTTRWHRLGKWLRIVA